MQTNRIKLLDALKRCSIGLSSKEMLEQSNQFIFAKGQIVTFNDEIMVSTESPIDFNGAVPADDLLKMLGRFPDDTLEVINKSNEIIFKGKKRRAGITAVAEIQLPYTTVPSPDKWMKLGPDVFPLLLQASMTCGKDETQFLTTCVHITSDLIEACDNQRLLRATLKTGFTEELLIPASSLDAMRSLKPTRFSIGKGWLHFRLKDGTIISMRCSHEKYHENISEALKIKNGKKMQLPSNLKEIIERAEAMTELGYDARVTITLSEDGLMEIRARKENGWYEERKKTKYDGPALSFEVHPRFLAEVVSYTNKVELNAKRMKLITDKFQFVVSLQIKAEGESEDAEE